MATRKVLTGPAPTMADLAGLPENGRCNPYVVQLKLVLIMTISHFQYPGLLDEKRMDHAMQAGRRSLLASQKLADVRLALGLSQVMWLDFTRLFVKAIPALERQSFAPNDPITPGYSGSSSNLIASNFIALLKDVERINDLCIIARNMLATKSEAQDMAADIKFDQLILRLIDVCVRVTARGYDGEAGTRAEEKWQQVINAYKKLLITCLQFLHNFVMNNERRKLLLWMDLFGSSPCADPSFMSRVDPAAYFQAGTFSVQDSDESEDELGNEADQETAHFVARSSVIGLPKTVMDDDKSNSSLSLETENVLRSKLKAVNLNGENAHGSKSASPEVTPKVKERAVSAPPYPAGSDMPDEHDSDAKPAALRSVRSKERGTSPGYGGEVIDQGNGGVHVPPTLNGRPVVSPLLVASNFTGLDSGVDAKPEDDTLMYIGPAAAAQILQLSKSQLIDRLHDRGDVSADGEQGPVYDDEGSHELRSELEEVVGDEGDDGVRDYLRDEVEDEGDDQVPEREMHGNGSEPNPNESVDDDDDDDDDENSYQGPGDQERGLLTDIPLVLGPNEIEALPMIIQTGIVDAFATKPPEGIHENMQAIRANVLIAQESGRNLLRELLIFIAAWDLADDEVYFKMMMQIMEALLINGLIPCTYGWFQESGPYNNPRLLWSPPHANRRMINRAKDIISPSQAVMIKLLTQIFRAKQSQSRSRKPSAASSSSTSPQTDTSSPNNPHNIPRVDIFVVRYIFGQFRLTVIPETCALIYLQGQIHAGKVDTEDFPLNLWDMERVYEGVYQFLEFFAVLTESEEWKHLLVEWQITHELVALLRELHAGIPRGGPETPCAPVTSPQPIATNGRRPSPAPPPPLPSTAGPVPVAVERPYDPSPPPSLTHPPHAPLSPPSPLSTPHPQPPHHLPTDDPQSFTWRNLKKLVVLVLSSLVWKSPVVQDQVRSHGGVEMILNCCSYDSHNPFIREHAIMCLRFLLEENDANQQLVRELERKDIEEEARQGMEGGEVGHARGGEREGRVPKEVLERGGWETFVDSAGRVGLRRKEGSAL